MEPHDDNPPVAYIAFNARLVGYNTSETDRQHHQIVAVRQSNESQGNARRKKDLENEWKKPPGYFLPLTDEEKSLDNVPPSLQYVLLGVLLPSEVYDENLKEKAPKTFRLFDASNNVIMAHCDRTIRVGMPVKPESKASRDSIESQKNKANGYALIDRKDGLCRPIPIALDDTFFYYPEWMEGIDDMTDFKKRKAKIKAAMRQWRGLSDEGNPHENAGSSGVADAEVADSISYGGDLLEKVVLGVDPVTEEEAQTATKLLSKQIERSSSYEKTKLRIYPKSLHLLSKVLRQDKIMPVDKHLVHGFLVSYAIELEDDQANEMNTPSEDDVRRAITKAGRRARITHYPQPASTPPVAAVVRSPREKFQAIFQVVIKDQKMNIQLAQEECDKLERQWGLATNHEPLLHLLRNIPGLSDYEVAKEDLMNHFQVINQQNTHTVKNFLRLFQRSVEEYQRICDSLGVDEEKEGQSHRDDEDDEGGDGGEDEDDGGDGSHHDDDDVVMG